METVQNVRSLTRKATSRHRVSRVAGAERYVWPSHGIYTEFTNTIFKMPTPTTLHKNFNFNRIRSPLLNIKVDRDILRTCLNPLRPYEVWLELRSTHFNT